MVISPLRTKSPLAWFQGDKQVMYTQVIENRRIAAAQIPGLQTPIASGGSRDQLQQSNHHLTSDTIYGGRPGQSQRGQTRLDRRCRFHT